MSLLNPTALSIQPPWAERVDLRIICSTRRIEDAYASWVEAFCWEEDRTITIMRMAGLLRNYAWISAHASLPADRPDALVECVADRSFHSPDITLWEAWSIARRHAKSKVKRRVDEMRPDDPGTVDVGFSYYDNATFFHRRHVSTVRSRPAEARLDAETVTRVHAALGRRAERLGIN